jgi:hypothetical protein
MDKLSGDRLMLTPIYFDAIDHGLQTTKESDQLHWASSQPQIGDRLPMGGDRLWQVVTVDRYAGDAGDLYIAYVHPVGAEVAPREAWYEVKCLAKRPLTNTTLHVKPDGSLHQTGCNFTGALPIVHRLLTSFDVTNHKTGSQPWGIESYDSYKPVSDEATFMAVYVTHLAAVDLSEVPGAIDLESEKTPEMAVAQ